MKNLVPFQGKLSEGAREALERIQREIEDARKARDARTAQNVVVRMRLARYYIGRMSADQIAEARHYAQLFLDSTNDDMTPIIDE